MRLLFLVNQSEKLYERGLILFKFVLSYIVDKPQKETMKLKNKLDITTEKYWLKNESVAIKGSLSEILDLELYSATKLKDLLSEDIDFNETRLVDYTTGFFAKFKKLWYKNIIEWHTKDLAKKKEQLNYISNNHHCELYIIKRHRDSYDGYTKEIWKYRTTDKEFFVSKEFLETQFIYSLAEITESKYISERQSLGESKARWKAHSEKFDLEKNKKDESDTNSRSIWPLILMILLFGNHILNREIITERSCMIKDDYVGCQFTVENPDSSTTFEIKNEVKNSNHVVCVESKVDDKPVIRCKADLTEQFKKIKSIQSEKLGLSKELSNTEFMEAIKKFPPRDIHQSIEFLESNLKDTNHD